MMLKLILRLNKYVYIIVKLTNELGYDGGAFFSHDEKKIVFRASRPNTDEEKDLYTKMLK